MDLTQKSIVITGGTSGIGTELVRRLHHQSRLFVIARQSEHLDRLTAEFPSVIPCRSDLSSPDQVSAAAANVMRQFSHVDLLINNAAIQHTPHLLDPSFSYESIEREIAVNLTAACCLTARLLPRMVRDEPTAVLNVNSGLALVPKTQSAVYCATKGGLNLFSQSLRNQLEGTNVMVLQAFLPLVDTPMTAGRGEDKMTAAKAAERILHGIEHDIEDHDIGKVKLLRLLVRLAPGVARRIMKRA
jgi:uncharacterized oxidoreductase